MRELLEKLHRPGVRYAALIHLDGFSLASVKADDEAPKTKIQGEEVAVLASALCGAAKVVSGLFPGGGRPQDLHLHDEAAMLHFYWITANHALLLVTESDLGTAEMDAAVQPLKTPLANAIASGAGPEIIRFGDDIALSDLSAIPFD